MAIQIGPLEIGRAVRLRGKVLPLRPMEARLLRYLAEHPGRVHTRESLLQAVWGRDTREGGRTVDVHVARLRRALNGAGHALITVRRVGYRLDPDLLR